MALRLLSQTGKRLVTRLLSLEGELGVASWASALTEGGPMECTRCGGLMVVDNLIDMRESSMPMWMKGWRCVSCGNIVDPLIQRHRMIQQAGASRLLGPEAAMPRLRHTLKAIA